MEDHPRKQEMEMMDKVMLTMWNQLSAVDNMLIKSLWLDPANAFIACQQLQSLANNSIICFWFA